MMCYRVTELLQTLHDCTRNAIRTIPTGCQLWLCNRLIPMSALWNANLYLTILLEDYPMLVCLYLHIDISWQPRSSILGLLYWEKLNPRWFSLLDCLLKMCSPLLQMEIKRSKIHTLLSSLTSASKKKIHCKRHCLKSLVLCLVVV